MMGKHSSQSSEQMNKVRRIIISAYHSAQDAEDSYFAAVETFDIAFYKERVRNESLRYEHYRAMARELFDLSEYELDTVVFGH